MRNLKSLLILSIVATSVFLIFPSKSFAGFTCSASGTTATFSLTGCPNPTVPALKFGANLSFPWSSATIRSTFAQCEYPASVSLSSGLYYFGAYDSNNFSYGGCSVTISGSGSTSGGKSITPPPASGSGTPTPAPTPAPTGAIAVSISGIPSASYTITGPTTITGTNTATYSPQPTGTYTIIYTSVAGYTTPSSQSLTLTDSGTITFSGTYVQTGIVIAIVSGVSSASWRIAQVGACGMIPTFSFWDYSGSSSSSPFPVGCSYTITWNTVTGYTTPATQSFTVPIGGITLVGNYISKSDLTAGPITPVTATTGTATSFTSSISNIGSGDSIVNATLLGTYTKPRYSSARAYDSKQNAIWITDQGSTNVTKRDASNGDLLGTYAVGANTLWATYDVTQNAVWMVSNFGNTSNKVIKLNAINGAIISTYNMGTESINGITYDVTQNAVWMTSGGSDKVIKLDASDGTLKSTTLFSVGTYPVGITYDVTQNAVWVAKWDSTIAKLNAFDGTISATYATGIPYSPQITYDVTQNAVWVAKWDSTVTKLNALDGTSLGTYTTGGSSYITYDVTQNAVWITGSSASAKITKLNAFTGTFIATYNILGDDIIYDSKQNAIWINVSDPYSRGDLVKLDASTGPGFHNFFQVATAVDGGGIITDLASSTMSSVVAGASATATSSPYTFTTAGTYSVRACADNASSAGGGLVPESNENNNCGAWTNITVTSTSGTPTGSITTNDCTITSGTTCPANVLWTTSNATSTSIQQNSVEFSTSASGNTSRNISYGLNTFMLFNGSTLLDTKYVVGSASDQGATGSANGTTRDTAPSTYAELCASGTASTVTTTANGWQWTCGSGIGIVTGIATKTSTAICGNSTCESSETLLSCPTDCKGKIQQF